MNILCTEAIWAAAAVLAGEWMLSCNSSDFGLENAHHLFHPN
jgi:hypothetical protein